MSQSRTVEICRLQGNLPARRSKPCPRDSSVGTPIRERSHPGERSLSLTRRGREEPYSTTAFPMDYAIPPSPKAPPRGVPTQRPFKLNKQRIAENPQCLV